jgi:hypothetical protein
MNMRRRDALLTTLFGAGGVGLRALATGLPAAAFLRPLSAFGQTAPGCVDATKAQYLILSTSSAGDPVNANAPGTYDFPDIVHAADPSMEGVPLVLGDQPPRTAARVWSTLAPTTLARTSFFHHATLTNNHPNLPKVLSLMGSTARAEMLPSIFAKQLAPCLGTVQTEPVSIGAGEILTFEGRGLPNLPPTGLRDVLTKPDGALKDLTQLRDTHLDRIHEILKQRGTKGQKDYLDRLALSRRQARSLADDLLDTLAAIKSNRSDGQVAAAAALIRMNVSPVIAIKIDFGGDNHTDAGLLAAEVPQATTGVQRINDLMTALAGYGLTDRVTFAMLNVFGRTLKKLGTVGRDHWASHNTAVLIGKNVRPGVIGGLEAKGGDYAATAINSTSGAPDPAGDIKFEDTLGSLGKTLGAALGVARPALDQQISRGKVVTSAVAG